MFGYCEVWDPRPILEGSAIFRRGIPCVRGELIRVWELERIQTALYRGPRGQVRSLGTFEKLGVISDTLERTVTAPNTAAPTKSVRKYLSFLSVVLPALHPSQAHVSLRPDSRTPLLKDLPKDPKTQSPTQNPHRDLDPPLVPETQRPRDLGLTVPKSPSPQVLKSLSPFVPKSLRPQVSEIHQPPHGRIHQPPHSSQRCSSVSRQGPLKGPTD